ncbi:hypothetical protein P4159_02710 [Bacillus thuringiensis]|uniref:hypothetical protein n=1 Tax=Bacillus thuringiensis TaxID=1428 RepID=UPI0007C1F5D7|nr:hypothetical protein [Bacillus thuringiensis]AND10775.1 hypothetical protein Bt4C1_27330 [Bacillus thuringiensis serovar alesti]MEC3594163.1 hypothetical protein [Bacillus thuringiensis]MED1834863.1 hypothetical protein [Bacillus thuringiensis]MED2210926.1 hypothetical protein [Bacillus thuringiensis]MED2669642.1 hypothetical protein [Bacillus thuringiensis]
MEYLNMADIVKLKLKLAKLEYDTDRLNNTHSTFIRNCNNKLASIDLQIKDFKTEEGEYKFTVEAAKKLIQLEELSVKKSLSKMKKEEYDAVDLTLIEEYFAVLECLIKLHFNDTRKEIYLWKIKALKTEVKINKERKNIINHLYLGDSEQKHFSMLGENLAKTIVDIYSINKYPYLTEADRDSLLHELYENLNGFMSDHSRTIEIANDIRNSEDEQIKEMPIEQIILEY